MTTRTSVVALLLMGCTTTATEPTVPAFLTSASQADYTIVYIPDTQYYSETYPATFNAQVQWIASHRDSLNIVFVSHLGDVVEHVPSGTEWQRASTSIAVLDAIGMPLGIAPGNHDLRSDWVGTAGSWKQFRLYFPASRYSTRSWWVGYYKASTVSRASSYQKIVASGDSLLFLHLEFQAPDDVLAWARGVVQSHPNHQVLVSTHSYLEPSGLRDTGARRRLNGNEGVDLWQELVRGEPNIRLVHSAHFCGEARAIATNDAGFPVHEILTDYQCLANGGDGWLRFYVVRPALGIIDAYTYSPTRNEWDTDSASQFTLSFTP